MNGNACRSLVLGGLEGNILKITLFRMLLMSMSLPISIIVLFWKEHGLSMFEVMALQAIFAAALALLEVPSGYTADCLGRKRAITAGIICDWIGVIVYSFSHGFSGFLAAELCMALGISLISGADEALLYDSLVKLGRENSFSRIWGKVRGCEMGFAAVGCAIGGCLAVSSYRLPFYMAAVLETGAVIAAFSLVEPQRHKLRAAAWTGLVQTARESLISNARLRWFLLYSAVFNGVLQIAFWMYQPYLQLCGNDTAYFGLLYFAMNVIAAFSAGRAHWLMQRMSAFAVALLLTAVTAVSLVCLGNIVFAGSFLFIFLHQAARGVGGIYFSTCINQSASSAVRATVISIGSLVSRLIYAAALLPMGLLVDSSGVLAGLNVLALGLLASGAMLAIWRPPGKPRRCMLPKQPEDELPEYPETMLDADLEHT